MITSDVFKFTKLAEGLSLKPYRCPAGKLTIGYGHNLEANGISEEIANQLLHEDLDKSESYVLKTLGHVLQHSY